MSDSPFKPGARVRDQSGDDDSDLAIVVACPELPAGEYEIEDTGQTVADYNPDCDPSTPVVEVVFLPALDASPLDWTTLPPDELADQVAGYDLQTYAYPVSRLAHITDAVSDETENSAPANVTAWFDGLCEPTNPGGHGAYGLLVEADGEIVHETAEYLGTGDGDSTMTNNITEYEAAIAALEYVAATYPTANITLKGDSQLVIRQLIGQYSVNSPRLRSLWRNAHTLVRDLDVSLEWVPREQNERADRLSRTAYHEHVTRPAREAREQRAHHEDMTIEHLEDAQYSVKDMYIVDLDDESCTCPDYEYRGQPCKHLYAVKDASSNP